MNKLFEELVAKALQGEPQAIEELLQQLRPLVIAYSKKYGGRQGIDEDAYQEGMLEILEGLKDYDISRGIPFLAYISTRIRYYYHNRRRRKKICYSLEEKVVDGGGSFKDLLEDVSCDIEGEYIKEETYQELYQAMEKLTPCQKAIVIQYYFRNKRLKEIAEMRGSHLISVAKTKGLALKKLKKILEKVY